MRMKLTRFGVLFVPLLAIIASLAPPAEARAAGGLTIVGTASVGPLLSYPCTGDGAPDLTKCPPPIGNGGWTTSVTFTGNGVGSVTSVTKPKCTEPTCNESGLFTVSASGFVTGHCGLSSGSLSGTVVPSLTVAPFKNGDPLGNAKVRTFSVTFTGLGGLLVVTGSTNKGEILAGAVLAVPNPADGSSCTNKRPKTFVVAGPVAVAR